MPGRDQTVCEKDFLFSLTGLSYLIHLILLFKERKADTVLNILMPVYKSKNEIIHRRCG